MRKDSNPTRTARREAIRRRRLPKGACCALCGESRPETLELHHVFGRAHNQKYAVVLCANCHRVATEDQIREGVPLGRSETLLGRIAAMIQALAAWFRSIAVALDTAATQLWEIIVRLDASVPEWRDVVEVEG